MSYKKQNFEDGQILTAEHLNHIEEGIIENEKNASKSLRYDYQNLSEAQKSQARTNIGAVGQGDLESATNTALAKAKASGEFNGKDGAQGEKGDKGDKGDKGEQGSQGIQGIQGEKGADGYTPVKGKDYFDGTNGKDGKDGVDGKTPVKGTDYFTEADKTEMVQSVISALPKYNGEVIEI